MESNISIKDNRRSNPLEQISSLSSDVLVTRHLTHFQHNFDRQDGCAKYLITFSTYNGQALLPSQKDSVFNAIRFWDGKKYQLFAVAITSKHVHMIINPLFAVSVILRCIKRFTELQINNTSVTRMKLWQDEDSESVISNGEELSEMLEFIVTNPCKADLAGANEDHRWLYIRK